MTLPDQHAATDDRARICKAIEHAAHLLPSQGPITVFIHHNTLHAFEELPFAEAAEKAGRLYGCQPYMAEERYRKELARGRMLFSDVRDVLCEMLGIRAEEKPVSLCTRSELRLAMLQYPLRYGPTEELLWFVAETDALRRVRDDVSSATQRRLIAETRRWVMRDLRGGHESGRKNGNGSQQLRASAGVADLLDRFAESRIEEWSEAKWEAFTLQALWRVCRNGVAVVPESAPIPPAPVRHRDLLLQVTGEDTDLLVNDLLIRFCGAFLDQGLANWPLPARNNGFYASFLAVYGLPGGPPEPWLHGLSRELARLSADHISPLQSIRESLDALGISEERWQEYIAATLIALRGWAGMIWFLEQRPDRAVNPVPRGSLIEYVAIRLILKRLAIEHVARSALGYHGPIRRLQDALRRRVTAHTAPSVEQRAFLVFQLAQILGWSPAVLNSLGERDWGVLLQEIEAFSTIERRRVFHLAYERRFYTQVLDTLLLHAREQRQDPPSPKFQAMFCIDERAESIRRHIEELAPDATTYGIAGFYFIDMYYRGFGDAHFVPLCPAMMLPSHWVVEKVDVTQEDTHQRRTKTRRTLGMASHQIHVGSRRFALGTLISAVGGFLATAPLIARILFPRVTAQLRRAFGKVILAPPPTRLQLERAEPTAAAENGHIGYSLDEMADIAERVLRDTGLTSDFARLVLTFGHGSTSMNNPHESAHDCGACGGARGGPSGRAIAQILNDPRVRQRLAQRGLIITAKTVFVGGMHNTSSEAITYYDVDLVPESHRELFDEVRELIEQAGDRDAHERCRRFRSAPLTLSYDGARQHVEGRAEDLSQVRPEWGHATNAATIVGRRKRTRGLFLDRRVFLNSYDPTQDDDHGTILERILRAAVPVCAGISLEYYFSYVDNTGYGCGTKLPHNVASLLGVMDGAASDLRTGLPWQMVEIHEPVRQLFVVETTSELMQRVLARNPGIEQLARNEWFRLAILDPDAPVIRVYRDGAFQLYEAMSDELPRAASSVDWYRGWRGHLEFAQIGNPLGVAKE